MIPLRSVCSILFLLPRTIFFTLQLQLRRARYVAASPQIIVCYGRKYALSDWRLWYVYHSHQTLLTSYCAIVSSGKKLGRGAFATVYLGQHKYTGEPVAIKVVDLERLSTNNKKLKKHLESEIEIMNSLKHENIVLQHDVIVVRSSFPPLPLSSSHKLWLTLISD